MLQYMGNVDSMMRQKGLLWASGLCGSSPSSGTLLGTHPERFTCWDRVTKRLISHSVQESWGLTSLTLSVHAMSVQSH
jgi:hypothetical protein